MVTSVVVLQVNPFFHPSNWNTEMSSRVMQQVLFSVTVFAFPSVPEWLIKSGDSSSFLRPLQRIPSSSQHLVFCLYRFSVFSSCIFLRFLLFLFYLSPFQPTFMFFRFPFMRAICRKWFWNLNMIFWGLDLSHMNAVFSCGALAFSNTADMHKFFVILVVNYFL